MPTITDFKAKLKNGGARANQFRVQLNFPNFANPGRAGEAASFLCNATSLPAVTIGNIALSYRGRPVNFAGEREFAPWSVTIINDGDFLVRDAFERWSNAIANFDQTNGTQTPTAYQLDMQVFQLDRNGNGLKAYNFIDAYPIEIGAIALAYDNPNIETFDVTFQYNYYVPIEPGNE